ncbi:MAG: hypothetical protein AB7J35_15555 [Dehalococcoidia bacterium]
MTTPPLDQVSSQALARIAAERGLAMQVTPAGDEVVRVITTPRWKRALPFVFFGVSLFALASMALGITTLADDGWSWYDAVQLVLMGLLVFGVFTQARSMFRLTPAGRWWAARKAMAVEAPPSPPGPRAHSLDVVSAEYLAALRPAVATPMSRGAVARSAGSRAFERLSVIVVLCLAAAAFAGMLFVLGFIVYAAGPLDSAVWLTAPFTALTGFATYQLFRSARTMSFRGRPMALFSRAFRDSVRLWGSGSLAVKVAFTTTATASVAGAVVAPQLVKHDTLFDVFVVDAETNAVYSIDLQTEISTQAVYQLSAVVHPLGGATQPTQITLSGGRKLPRATLYVVVESAGERLQGIVAFRPGSNSPIQVSRIQPEIPDGQFTGGDGVLHAIQPDGSLWTIDIVTGAATKAGQVTVPPGPFTYEAEAKAILMISGNDLVRIDPETGSATSRFTFKGQEAAAACGLADGPEDRIFFARRGSAEISVLKTKTQELERFTPTGVVSLNPCTMVVAYRR